MVRSDPEVETGPCRRIAAPRKSPGGHLCRGGGAQRHRRFGVA